MHLLKKSYLHLAVMSVLISHVNFTFAEDVVAESEKPVTEQLVNTLTKLAGGPHAGYRANHAKGIVVQGEFTPAASAASITKAAHLQNQPSNVIVRFSDATGVPNIPDANGNAFPKGMAIRFQLPDDGFTDIVVISVNGFPAATPEDFLGLLNAVAASGPDAPKPSQVETFLNTHPAAAKFVSTPKPAPISFATQAFYGVNAFKFTNAQGETHYGRYIIEPVKGQAFLTKEEQAKAAPNYLMDELPQRLAKEATSYRITLQVANPGDEVNDATVAWPSDREVIELGTLTLRGIHPQGEAFAKANMYNPLALVEGIEPSNDPILLARPGAYAVSYGRRLK
ncbi:MAG: catalase family peroxidase [Methylophilus sp.]